jgi:hypothetical protein
MAYVSIYGGGRYHAVSAIDLAGQKALPDIDIVQGDTHQARRAYHP